MPKKNVKNIEAIQALVSMALVSGDYKIIEHNTGIDVDNAGRSYDHETEVDYKSVMWDVLNYMNEERLKPAFDGFFHAEVEIGDFGGTDTRVLSFSIETGYDDSESTGVHFEFKYPRLITKFAYEIGKGDLVYVGGKSEPVEVVATRYHGSSKVVLEVEHAVEGSTGYIVEDESTLKVLRYR